MKKQGFILIEILIASAVASIVSILLVSILFQLNRTRAYVDRRTETTTRIATTITQLNKDISTLTTALFIETEDETEQDNNQADIEKLNKENDKKTPLSNSAQKNIEPQQSALIGTMQNELFSMMSFTSHSTLQFYHEKQSILPFPSFGRITYYCLADPHNKDRFCLYRQQSRSPHAPSAIPDAQTITNLQDTYLILDHIIAINVTYYYSPTTQEDQKQLAPENNQAPEGIIKTSSTWPLEEKNPSLPQAIEFNITLGAPHDVYKKNFILFIPIIEKEPKGLSKSSDEQTIAKENQQKKPSNRTPAEKKQKEKTDSASAGTTTGTTIESKEITMSPQKIKMQLAQLPLNTLYTHQKVNHAAS